MDFIKKQKLIKWLKDYANNNKCHVCINSDYSPCVIAIWGNPTRKYDEEDGYWKWTSKDKNFKFKWIDDEIPEELKMARFDLMGNIGIKFSPENK